MLSPILSGMLAGLLLPQNPPPLQPQVVPENPFRTHIERSGSGAPPAGRLSFPVDPGAAWFAPFSAPGQTKAEDAAAAGAADLDGDGNQDLWFLTPSVNAMGESRFVGTPGQPATTHPSISKPTLAGSGNSGLSVQMARTSSLGRFRPWHIYPERTWRDGATFRSTAYPRGDRVLLVEPDLNSLVSAYYTYPFGGSPRSGLFVVNAAWQIDYGAYEVETRDDDGDGHDDIAVLQSPQPGWTRIKKLRMGDSLGWLQPESEVTYDFPWVARNLRLLDYDGDGLSDALFTIPGVGIFLLRDDGQALVPVLGIPMLNDLQAVFAGDADSDGRDDFGLVVSQGIFLVLSKANGFEPTGLPTPPGAGPLRTGCVLGDGQGNLTSVLGFPRAGASVLLFPHLGDSVFGGARLVQPPGANALPGGSSVGPCVIVADVDGDADQDVVMQLADRSHWVTLRNGEHDLSPAQMFVIDHGVVGATGYHKFGLVMRVPHHATQLGLSDVELAVFLEDITVQPSNYIYWGRLIGAFEPATQAITFTIYSQNQPNELNTMIQNRQVFRFPDGITAGGDALLSIHLKQGPKRHQSLLLYYDSGGQGNKSAVGVKWKVRADPPKANMDTDLLPWN